MVTRDLSRLDERATAITRARYQRLAPIYDRVEAMMEARYRPWRATVWQRVTGQCILEVGMGTGKNMPYWPRDAVVTGIDLTPGMLALAQRRAAKLGLSAELRLGDVQALDFADGTFDTVVATFVFCSVPDPIQGLRELGRVVRPGGQILLLEHVRVNGRLAGLLMDGSNPLIVRLIGANINRPTVANVQAAGLEVKQVVNLGMGGMYKLIEARPGIPAAS
jgi:phosphatidylethanolamine/phosphatidyl-N-methylethanolamine N-methyltransferase